jgi:hypothetical protein
MPKSETSTVKAAVEEDDFAFLKQLVAEFETPLDLDPTLDKEKSSDVRKALLERLGIHLEAPSKADLYELDRLTLELASDVEVVAQAPGLYRRYCQERGETIDANDPAMNPPKPEEKEKVKVLRAQMLEILRALHWSYTFGPIREKRRVRLIKESMLVMVVATAIMGALVGILRHVDHRFYAMLVAVVYAGVMGGAVSCAHRLGNIPTTGDALGSIYALKNSHYILFFAPITGAVFAVVTMLLFMGELMTGPLFPSFTRVVSVGSDTGPWTFTHTLLPSSSSGYALLFLWCFIAGFAERFVPDTLNELTKRAAAQKTDAGKEATLRSH